MLRWFDGFFHPRFVYCAFLLSNLLIGEYQIFHERTCSFDWDAYMEQVAHVGLSHSFMTTVESPRMNFNYTELQGDTGALVYPAGHVWIHTLLQVATGWDEKRHTTEYEPKRERPEYMDRIIRPTNLLYGIQNFYLCVSLLTLAVVWELYVSCGLVGCASDATTVAFLLSLTWRNRSIPAMGLFNDTFATLAVTIAMLLFIKRCWVSGSILFSVAVSIKMNVLLYAPGLLVVLLCVGGIAFAAKLIALCALVQVVIASPFLYSDAVSYVTRAFNLGRAFDHINSINWRWLPHDVFASKYFSGSLLALHLLCLAFAIYKLRAQMLTILSSGDSSRGAGAAATTAAAIRKEEVTSDDEEIKPPRSNYDVSGSAPVLSHRSRNRSSQALLPGYGFHNRSSDESTSDASAQNVKFSRGLVYLLWASNIIGVACARSLHFQFLIWYFHSLPFLLMASGVPLPVRLAFILVLELAWNAHPPGETSSMIVTGCHAVLLLLLTYADNAFLADFFDGLRWKGSRAGKGEEMETLGGIPTSAGSDSKRRR